MSFKVLPFDPTRAEKAKASVKSSDLKSRAPAQEEEPAQELKTAAAGNDQNLYEGVSSSPVDLANFRGIPKGFELATIEELAQLELPETVKALMLGFVNSAKEAMEERRPSQTEAPPNNVLAFLMNEKKTRQT